MGGRSQPFLAYLWGIETLFQVQPSQQGHPFLAYLWGIETRSAGPGGGWGNHVFSLPMRNWNHTGWRPKGSPGTAFLAYLWGIETAEEGAFSVKSPAFLAYLWGIETVSTDTMSALPATFLAYLWGIETQRNTRLQIPHCEVFSLPMRNWNSVSRMLVGRPAKPFLAYLWGIETFQP